MFNRRCRMSNRAGSTEHARASAKRHVLPPIPTSTKLEVATAPVSHQQCTYRRPMPLRDGSHVLGSPNGSLEIHTSRGGVAQKVGHDLIIDTQRSGRASGASIP